MHLMHPMLLRTPHQHVPPPPPPSRHSVHRRRQPAQWLLLLCPIRRSELVLHNALLVCRLYVCHCSVVARIRRTANHAERLHWPTTLVVRFRHADAKS